MILVDTSVIADIFTKDPDWFEWSSGQIERWANQGAVCYDAIIFA
jgi:predicted nucleic acid-binding protein